MDTQVADARRSRRDARTAEAAAVGELIARVRRRVPPEMTPEQIEAEIAAAHREARQARHARRR